MELQYSKPVWNSSTVALWYSSGVIEEETVRSFRVLVLFGIAAIALGQTPGTQTPVTQTPTQLSVRVLLGTTDTQSVKWDGSLQAEGASILSLEPWRFEGADSISGATWQVSTHPV